MNDVLTAFQDIKIPIEKEHEVFAWFRRIHCPVCPFAEREREISAKERQRILDATKELIVLLECCGRKEFLEIKQEKNVEIAMLDTALAKEETKLEQIEEIING